MDRTVLDRTDRAGPHRDGPHSLDDRTVLDAWIYCPHRTARDPAPRFLHRAYTVPP